MVELGISVDRWFLLRRTDDTFLRWSDGVISSVSNCVRMVALDESLTKWKTEHHVSHLLLKRWPRPLTDLPTYHKATITPPARPEWLEVLW